MGKGGTKFEGEAIGVRGKAKVGLTGKEMRRNMERFLETGVHPEVERAEREAAAEGAGPVSLPDHDPHRPFVFWDLSIDNKPAGRLVIELYEDLHPIGAAHLRNRCLPGATASLAGASFQKLLRHFAAFVGKSPAAAAPALRPSRFCRNSELGAVSVSNDGTEVAVVLGRSLALDATHQVVGRVHLGREALEGLSDIGTTPDDAPLSRIKIVRCGATNAKGTHDTLDDSAKETAAEAAERLQRESRDTKASIEDALNEAMKGAKRKAPEASASGAGASGSGSGAAAAAAARNVRGRVGMMDPLAGLSSDDEEGSSSEGGGGSGGGD